ncbi:hypothetical protein RRG08_052026 [Elysia crispata]|uniref:Uncharacterized protein n=1 Tax=Elysia crispata TaxID=231223 RepID=A0AAE1D0E3_9GAST|nr:hypothetical protein RRG08_052026 [Elysia crispata]
MKRVCLMNVPIGSDALWLYSPVQSENHMSPQLSGPVEEGKQTEWRQSIDPGYLIVSAQPSTASSPVLASILVNTFSRSQCRCGETPTIGKWLENRDCSRAITRGHSVDQVDYGGWWKDHQETGSHAPRST